MSKPDDPVFPGGALSVGEVARRSGVAVSTLHFYETKGLIFSLRTEGNQRRYPRGILRRVAVIKVAQRTGIPSPRSRPPWPTCPATARRRRRTGPSSHAHGGRN